MYRFTHLIYISRSSTRPCSLISLVESHPLVLDICFLTYIQLFQIHLNAMPSFWRRPFQSSEESQSTEVEERGSSSGSDPSELVAGGTYYVAGKAANNTEVSYQDASGAPVEESSPLGYNVGPMTILFLNVSKMIGTGIFSTREQPFFSTSLPYRG